MSDKFEYKITIREFHLDTFGHVNNATYLQIYEEARWELITSNGYGLKEIQKAGKGPIILAADIKFLKELKLREEITVTTESVSYEGKILMLKQEVLKADGTVANSMMMTAALFDTRERKLIPPTPEWLKAVGLNAAK